MSALEILGIGSAFLALIAFVGNQYGKLDASSFTYDTLNFASAAGLFMFAYAEGVVPFMLTNSVWGLVSGIDVAKHILKGKRLKKRRK